jgi:hypothetical protein
MTRKQESLLFAAICVVMILLSAGGLVYGVVARLILAPDAPFSLDGILLALVCLSMGGLFTLMLLVIARKEGWLPGKKSAPKKDDKPPSGES